MKNAVENSLTDKEKKIKTIFLIILVLVFSGILAVAVGKPMIDFVKEPALFRKFVKSHGILSDMVFILMLVFQMVIAVIPGEPFEIAAGYAFGTVRGLIDCLLAFAIGGTVIFFAVRKFGVKIVEVFFPIEKIRQLKFLANSKRLNTATFIIFLIPGTPKDLLSYFVGLTDMKFSVWLVITTVARIPSLITSVLGGNALGKEKYEIALIVFLITLVISGIGLIIYRKFTNHNN